MPERGGPTQETMLRALKLMVTGRVADERSVNLQRQGRIGFYVQMDGQEAAQVGCGLALEPEDWVVPAYRELGVALARGVPLQTLFDQFYANSNDESKGRQMPTHYGYRAYRYVTASSPVGTQIIHAVGLGMAARYKGEKSVTVPFFGDGATSSSDFHAGLNFAGVYNAPVVFFCQNNGWAISLPREKQTRSKTLAGKAEAYGIRGVQVDGNDFAAVYRVVQEARERAVSGEGPTLVEALTYRMGSHSTSDDPTRYRSTAEVASWKQKDPIERLARDLIARGWITEDQFEALQEAARAEVQAAIQTAEQTPPTSPDTLFTDVFKSNPSYVEEQRAELSELVREGVVKP